MDIDRMLKPALIAGVATGVAAAVPPISFLNCFCCMLTICGGIFAAYLYIKDSPFPVSPGQGAMVGLLAGVCIALTTTLLSIPLRVFSANMALQILPRLDIPSELRRAIETGLSGPFTIFAIVRGLLMGLVGHGLFATLGGALGVSLFEKRKGEGGPYPPQGPPYTPPAYTPPNYPPASTTPPSSTPPPTPPTPPSEPGPPPQQP